MKDHSSRVNERDKPNIVFAPHPDDKTILIKLHVDPSVLLQFEDDNRNAKIGEYCGLVHGNVEEANSTSQGVTGTLGLLDSIALFKGVKRYFINEGEDDEIYIYVTNPQWTYIYPSRNRNAVIGPTRVSKPIDAVFVTYVKIHEDKQSGVILDWEWVKKDLGNPTLPAFYKVRYNDQLW